MQPDIRSRVAHPRLTIILPLTFSFLAGVLLCIPHTHADSEEKTYYYLYDHLGSVDVVLDDQGNVVERADYEPYGEDRLRMDGDQQPVVSPLDEHQYTSQELDAETGLYYYGARYYDPSIGRFISEDPWEGDLSNPQTLNKYSYVLNNPLKYVDPTGKYEEDVHYDLTYFLSLISGLGNSQATTVAFRDQYMDENPETKPNLAYNVATGVTQALHFATRKEALERIDQATESKSLEALGDAVHTFQDTYSHAGLTQSDHVWLVATGQNPDKTYSSSANIAKANRMARATFFQLRKFNLAVNGSNGLSKEEYTGQSTEIWQRFKNEINGYLSLKDKNGTKIETLSSISKND